MKLASSFKNTASATVAFRCVLAGALLAASVAAPPAMAATTPGTGAASLARIVGKVQVNSAVPRQGGALQVGDVVQTGSRSSAVVTFPDGCRISLSPNTTVQVGAVSPCSARGANARAGSQPGNTGAGGTQAGTATAAGGGATVPAVSTTLLVAGGIAVIGGGAAAIIAASSSSSSSSPAPVPVSP